MKPVPVLTQNMFQQRFKDLNVELFVVYAMDRVPQRFLELSMELFAVCAQGRVQQRFVVLLCVVWCVVEWLIYLIQKLLSGLWKNGDLPKLVADFLQERDIFRQTWKLSRFLKNHGKPWDFACELKNLKN